MHVVLAFQLNNLPTMPLSEQTRLSKSQLLNAPFIDVGVPEADQPDALDLVPDITVDSTSGCNTLQPDPSSNLPVTDADSTLAPDSREKLTACATNEEPVVGPSVTPTETVEILKACVSARVALASLNEACRHFSNQGLLESTLILLEARSSAELDGYGTDLQAVLRSLFHVESEVVGERSIAEVKEQAGNSAVMAVLLRHRALKTGLKLVRERSPGIMTAMEIAAGLAGEPVSIRRGPLSDSNNDVHTATPQGATPQGVEKIQRLLGEWEDFVQLEAGSMDPLVVMAIAYARFLAISPFEKDNDAIARCLCQLFLVDEELLPHPVINLSGYFRKHTTTHQRLFRQAGDTDPQQWIVFFVKAVEESAVEAYQQLNAMAALIRQTDSAVSRELPKMYSADLIEVIMRNPYCRIQDLVQRDIAKRQTASQYLKKLCQLGILTEHQHGKEKLFLNNKLVEILH